MTEKNSNEPDFAVDAPGEEPAVVLEKKPAGKPASKKARQPGPKPQHLVVERTLKSQTLDGEISLSLVVPYQTIKKMMGIDDVPEADMIDFVLEEIMPPEESAKVLKLSDGIDVMAVTMAYMEAVGSRLGASMGESAGSSS